MAAPNRLAELPSARNEEAWNTLVVKFLSEDHAAVSATAALVMTSSTDVEDGNPPPCHPDDAYATEVLFDVISYRHRARRVRLGHDRLLVEIRRRAGRVLARGLTALLSCSASTRWVKRVGRLARA